MMTEHGAVSPGRGGVRPRVAPGNRLDFGPLGQVGTGHAGMLQTLERGQHLFRSGERSDGVFLLLAGSVKVYRLTAAGEEQVTGFGFAGDLIGLDALGNPAHGSSAVALEASRVRRLPLAALETECRRSTELQHRLLQLASGQITALQDNMLRLGRMSASERVASFLLEVTARTRSPDIVLSMSRYAIGCYLGLALETVSRVLGQFAHERLVRVRGRRIRLLQPQRLRQLVSRPLS